MSSVAFLTTRLAAWISGITSAVLILAAIVGVPDAFATAAGYSGNVSVLAPDVKPFDLQWLLSKYCPAGRQAMIICHLTFDAVFPVAYSLFLINLLVRLGQSASNAMRAIL